MLRPANWGWSFIGLMLLPLSTVWGQQSLRPRLAEGVRYSARERLRFDQKLTLNDKQLATSLDLVVTTNVSHGSQNDQGELPITQRFTALRAELGLPSGGKLSFDSQNPDVSPADPNLQPLLQQFQTQLEVTLLRYVDRDGKVGRVEGVTPASGLDAQELRLEYEQDLQRFPSQPVTIGQQWERNEVLHLGGGQVFTFRRQYEYVGPQLKSIGGSTRRLENIKARDLAVDYRIKPGAAIPGKVLQSGLKIQQSERTYWFDPALGRTVSSRSKVRLTGPLRLSIGESDYVGELDLSMQAEFDELP